MSNTLHKLKDAVHPKTQEYTGAAGAGHRAAAPEAAYSSSSNYAVAWGPHHEHATAADGAALPGPAPNTAGPHRHDILNKLDPSVDSKGAGQTVPGGVARPPEPTPGLPGPASTTGGPHHSNLINKLDPNVDSRTGGLTQPHSGAAPVAGTHHHARAGAVPVQGEAPEGTYGPHKSRIANALDPRVDSDLGGSSHACGAHRHATAAPARGEVPEGSYGPHHSRIANALDPRVDSDLDRNQAGTHGHGAPAAHHAPHHATHHGPAGAALPGPAPTTAGPHHSDILNKLDPTVDSRTGVVHESGAARHAGAVPARGGVPEGSYGPHHSKLANTLDPRVDSDLDRHYGATQPRTHAAAPVMSGAVAPGPAPTTAGPHRSDLMNKLDPTVDSKPHAGARY